MNNLIWVKVIHFGLESCTLRLPDLHSFYSFSESESVSHLIKISSKAVYSYQYISDQLSCREHRCDDLPLNISSSWDVYYHFPVMISGLDLLLCTCLWFTIDIRLSGLSGSTQFAHWHIPRTVYFCVLSFTSIPPGNEWKCNILAIITAFNKRERIQKTEYPIILKFQLIRHILCINL